MSERVGAKSETLCCGEKPVQCAGGLPQTLDILQGAATSGCAGEYWGWRGATSEVSMAAGDTGNWKGSLKG